MTANFSKEAALNGLSRQLFAFSHLDESSTCCSNSSELRLLARRPFELLDEHIRRHLATCTPCAIDFSRQRAAFLRGHLPESWTTALNELRPNSAVRGSIEYLGAVSLESFEFEAESGGNETSHPSRMRVKLTVTAEAQMASLLVFDVPSEITDIRLHTALGSHDLDRLDHDSFDVDIDLTDYATTTECLMRALEVGTVRLTFFSSCRDEDLCHQDDAASLLSRFNVIETEYDYILPSGLHADKHINIGRLCRSDYALTRAANCILEKLEGKSFDSIVCSGWAMDVIGQRLVMLCEKQGFPKVANVMCVGYSPITMLGDIARGSRVVILLDVIVTGGQLRSLRKIIAEFGAEIVDVVSMCSAEFPGASEEHLAAGLCKVPMRISRGQTAELWQREQRVFNPFSCYMTKKSGETRSPTDFLAQDEKAAEFWSYIEESQAYEHHRIERGTHYIAFVDTERLLNSPDIGDTLASNLARKVVTASGLPGCLLVPRRKRARILAEKLVKLWMKQFGVVCNVVEASYRNGEWDLPTKCIGDLRDKYVLVVDSAAGFGRTVDQLGRKASQCGALKTGAAVLISRLPPLAESSLNSRLPGGFVSLYSLPIQPVAVRANRRELCPICRHKDALEAAVSMTENEAIERWAKWLSRPPRAPTLESKSVVRNQRVFQLMLFPQSDATQFLQTCSGKVASGVTLHALNAARSNGMATLTLPELANRRIRATTRAAMVRHLPPSVLEWSRDLENDLESYLKSGDSYSIWQAAVEVLSRDGREAWIQYFGDFVRKSRTLQSKPAIAFWGSMVCNVFAVSTMDAEYRSYVGESVSALRKEYSLHGLEMVASALQRIGDDVESNVVEEFAERDELSLAKPR